MYFWSWQQLAECRECTSETWLTWSPLVLWYKATGWTRMSVRKLPICFKKRVCPSWWVSGSFQPLTYCDTVILALLVQHFYGPWKTSVWVVLLAPGEANTSKLQRFSKLRFKYATVALNLFVSLGWQETGRWPQPWLVPWGCWPYTHKGGSTIPLHANVADSVDRLACPHTFPGAGQQDL